MTIQLNNDHNPNGTPKESWVGVVDSFAIAIANPLKAIKKAPKGFTYKLYQILFWCQTLNATLSDNKWTGNINVDLNLWYVESMSKINVSQLAGKRKNRIARARLYYTKHPQISDLSLRQTFSDEEGHGTGWETFPGTGDVFTDKRVTEGQWPIGDHLHNHDVFTWRPSPMWNYSGVVVSPILYFGVSHGGVNNINKYGNSNTQFGITIEYDLVNIREWVEKEA